MPGISRVLPATALLAWTLALSPSAAQATYTGVRDATTVGTIAAGAGWIAVPGYDESSDPGTIDGTPRSETTSFLWVARAAGSRFIKFKQVSPSRSLTMGPMLAAGAPGVLTVAWTDSAGGGTVDSAVLNAGGSVPAPAMQTGEASDYSLRLVAGPDGAFAVSWRNSAGAHALAFPAGAHAPVPLLGPSLALDPAAQLALSGGSAFWLIGTKGGLLSVAPAVFGQQSAPTAVGIGAVKQVTALGDGTGGLWVLARGSSGWLAAHLDSVGHVTSTPLPQGAADAQLATAGTTAVVAYSAAPRCTSYLERLRPAAAANVVVERRKLTRRGSGCSTPRGLTVDPASATAYLLTQSRHGTTLTSEARGGSSSTWHASLTEAIDAVVAAGSGRVVVESHAPERTLPEQCGGAGPSFSQSYFIRVFHGARLERSGRLGASVMNC